MWTGKMSPRRAAHPRVSGENLGELTFNAIKTGSSPRERGKRR